MQSTQAQPAIPRNEHENGLWAELYQRPEDLVLARIVVETMKTDQTLMRSHPALYIQASRTVMRHEMRVHRWEMVGKVLRVITRVGIALCKRLASMIAAASAALIDASAKRKRRPDLQQALKDPVLSKALEEFLRRNPDLAAKLPEMEEDKMQSKAAGSSAVRS